MRAFAGCTAAILSILSIPIGAAFTVWLGELVLRAVGIW